MKPIFLILLIAFGLLLSSFDSSAQTVGSVTNISGTNYFPVQSSPGVFQTNSAFWGSAYKTITLGNISNTNELIQGYYVINPTNGLTPAPGFPGYYIIGSFSNSFNAGTNGGAWSYTFNGIGVTVPSALYLGLAISSNGVSGTFTNSAYVP